MFSYNNTTNLFCLKFLVSIPFFLKALVMLSHEKFCLKVFFEGCPVATNDAIFTNNRLKDAAVVVSLVLVVGQQDNVSALIADEVFVVG